MILDGNGFKRLNESDAWGLGTEATQTGKFYVTRNDSSIIAFTLGSDGPGLDDHGRDDGDRNFFVRHGRH